MSMLFPRTTTLYKIFRQFPISSKAFSRATFMNTSTPITIPSIYRPPLSLILSFLATYLLRSGEQPCLGSGLFAVEAGGIVFDQVYKRKTTIVSLSGEANLSTIFMFLINRRAAYEKGRAILLGHSEVQIALVIKFDKQLINMELESTDRLALLPKRPRGEYIKKFRSQNITTNHFKVEVDNFEQIYIFSIHYNPMIPFDNVILRRNLLVENIEKIKVFIHNPVISGNNIYTTQPPTLDLFQIQSGEYRINCKKVKVLDLKENPKLLLSFLNNGLRSVMRGLNYIEIGRSGKYFNTNEKTKIDNLMMFSGYRSNFVLLENGYYLRVDSAKKIVRDQTVLEIIDNIYKCHQDKDKQERRNVLQAQLTGKIIMTNYGKAAYYRIQEVVFQEIDSIQLEDAAMSLKDYYEKKYGLTITNKKQPLLKVESKRKNKEFQIFLIPQFCLMTGIPENFDEFRRKKISQSTIKPANEKQREILKLMSQLRGNQDFCSLKDMGIKINKNLETVKGRLIPMPRINLGENRSVEEGKEAFFQLYRDPIFASKHSIKCGIIYFRGQQTGPLLQTFESTSRTLKVKFEAVKLNMGDYDSRKALQMLEYNIGKAAQKEGCNICLIILPNQLKTQYKKVKNSALLKHRIICQMTTEATLRKKNLQSIATKILLQIIAKRGNTLWVPKVPSGLTTTMMIAFEGAQGPKKTTLGMCATINSTFSSIFSRTEQYSNVSEKFNLMASLSLKAIDAYSHRNKEVPAEVIILNSSTSGDQMIMFQEYYIKPLQVKLKEVYNEKTPSLTMVMVNVKTSERFFTEGDQNVRNVPAGTLIASEIVSNYYDFYVVSQSSNKGATLPNHYKVIYSDSKLEEGVLQELIFSQCFNYVNWTGSIKVPGILQYAEKCAKFNSEVLENQELCEQLQNKLYFV